MKRTLPMLILLLSVVRMHGQWTFIDTSITHTDAAFTSVYFTNDSTGYVVGGWSWSTGVILKTTDYGMSWNIQGAPNFLKSVYFPTKDTGYAVGEGRSILKTVDAGATWVSQYATAISTGNTLSDVVFVNKDTGFVSMRNGPQTGFLKTFDGGVTWVYDYVDSIMPHAMSRGENKVFAIQQRLVQTDHLGSSYSEEFLPPDGTANYLDFINDYVGFATMTRWSGVPCFNYGTLIKTTNAGQSWQVTDYVCGYAGGLHFPTDQVGFMLGDSCKFWKTSDQGTSWSHTTIPFYCSSFDMFCTDTSTCYIVNNNGTIIKTENGGGVGIFGTNTNDSQELLIYPNPTNSSITLEFETNSEKASFSIMNYSGQVVMKNEDLKTAKGKNEFKIDLNDFSNGIYLIQVQTGSAITSKKIIKN